MNDDKIDIEYWGALIVLLVMFLITILFMMCKSTTAEQKISMGILVSVLGTLIVSFLGFHANRIIPRLVNWWRNRNKGGDFCWQWNDTDKEIWELLRNIACAWDLQYPEGKPACAQKLLTQFSNHAALKLYSHLPPALIRAIRRSCYLGTSPDTPLFAFGVQALFDIDIRHMLVWLKGDENWFAVKDRCFLPSVRKIPEVRVKDSCVYGNFAWTYEGYLAWAVNEGMLAFESQQDLIRLYKEAREQLLRDMQELAGKSEKEPETMDKYNEKSTLLTLWQHIEPVVRCMIPDYDARLTVGDAYAFAEAWRDTARNLGGGVRIRRTPPSWRDTVHMDVSWSVPPEIILDFGVAVAPVFVKKRNLNAWYVWYPHHERMYGSGEKLHVAVKRAVDMSADDSEVPQCSHAIWHAYSKLAAAVMRVWIAVDKCNNEIKETIMAEKSNEEYEREFLEKLTTLIDCGPGSGLHDHAKERRHISGIRGVLVKKSDGCGESLSRVARMTDEEALNAFDEQYVLLEQNDKALVVDRQQLAKAIIKL